MRELSLELDPNLRPRQALEHALRSDIRSGRLTPDTRLPSTRVLAADLGVARTTVVAAYEQLTVEGYLVSVQGSATRVASQVTTIEIEAPRAPAAVSTRWDFRPGEPDTSMFPRRRWAQAMRQVVMNGPDDVFGMSDMAGHPELRRTVAEYLGRVRAVHASPAAVSIFGGTSNALGYLGEAFRRMGVDRVAIEDPSLFIFPGILELAGVEVVGVPIDDQGIDVDALDRTGAKAVIVTPCHQYPLGITMTPERRADLCAWAQSVDGWIVEDDYDGEYRYDRKPIGSLQGLDPDRVIYAGTTSKALGAGLRLSWLVVPDALRLPLAAVKHVRGQQSTIEQLTLAAFIEAGDLDRHLRKARARYGARLDLLCRRLNDEVDWLSVANPAAGLHLLIRCVSDGPTEADLMAAGAAAGVTLFGLSMHHIDRTIDQPTGLVLGYSRLAEHDVAEAFDRLIAVLQGA